MIVEPGMLLKAFRLDGTGVVGVGVSGPVRKRGGGVRRAPVVIDVYEADSAEIAGREEFPATLVEPYGETLTRWYELTDYRHVPKVYWTSLAYAILDDMLRPARWSAHMDEYVKVDWMRHEIRSDLGNFNGTNYDGPEVVKKAVSSDEFLERLAPAMWKFQEDQTLRLTAAIVVGTLSLNEVNPAGRGPRAIAVPQWARDFVQGAIAQANEKMGWSLKLRVIQGSFPMLMTGIEGDDQGRFVRLPNLEPHPRGW